MLNETEVRVLVAEAVHMARTTTPGNVCNEAVVQQVMKDEYKGKGGWRSRWFETDEKPEVAMMDVWLSYPRI